jgi:F-type H+-transporting ATPase subunit c
VKAKLLFIGVLALALAGPVFAQEPAGAPAAGQGHWLWVAAAFGMAIASAVCGLAQSRAVAAACEGMARNPGAAAAIRFALIFGLVLIESLALYTLVIIFILLFRQ